uniref:Uncharacterized protein n=1 Tax=Cucumis melo TaxID=3656 RepID=A0A9I9E037_CUCME
MGQETRKTKVITGGVKSKKMEETSQYQSITFDEEERETEEMCQATRGTKS